MVRELQHSSFIGRHKRTRPCHRPGAAFASMAFSVGVALFYRGTTQVLAELCGCCWLSAPKMRLAVVLGMGLPSPPVAPLFMSARNYYRRPTFCRQGGAVRPKTN